MPLEIPDAEECAICALAEASEMVVESSPAAIVVVPEWMRTRGSCVVAARRHVTTMFDLSPDELRDIFALAQQLTRRIVDTLDPDGLHFWWDTGVLAGQALPHFYIEVVPRYAAESYEYAPPTELPRRAAAELEGTRRALSALG